MKQILVTNCTKYDRTPVLGEIFPSIKNGLFLSAGKEHAWQRKMLNPAFSYASVLEFLTTFDKNVDNLIMVCTILYSRSILCCLTGLSVSSLIFLG